MIAPVTVYSQSEAYLKAYNLSPPLHCISGCSHHVYSLNSVATVGCLYTPYALSKFVIAVVNDKSDYMGGK